MSKTATTTDIIRAAMARKGMTQTQLAEAIGTSQSRVQRLLAGKDEMTLPYLARIAQALADEDVEAALLRMIYNSAGMLQPVRDSA